MIITIIFLIIIIQAVVCVPSQVCPSGGVSFSTLSTGRFVLTHYICKGAESAEHAETAGYTYEGTPHLIISPDNHDNTNHIPNNNSNNTNNIPNNIPNNNNDNSRRADGESGSRDAPVCISLSLYIYIIIYIYIYTSLSLYTV